MNCVVFLSDPVRACFDSYVVNGKCLRSFDKPISMYPLEHDVMFGSRSRAPRRPSSLLLSLGRVEVRSQYYPEQSNPLKDQYIFVYKVKITNQSSQTVQLVSRTWEIKAIEATEVLCHCGIPLYSGGGRGRGVSTLPCDHGLE